MSIKVAYLLGSLNRGGTETLLLDLFRNASQNELNAIGIYRKTGVYEFDFIKSAVPMHKLATGKNPLLYLQKLKKLLVENKIDLVHAQQPIDALYARWATRGTGIRIVLTFHGYDFNENGISRLILQYIIKRTHINIYVSHTQKQYYIEKYKLQPSKQKVVYNGISFDKFDAFELMNKSLRSELQLSASILLIGTVGNFVSVRDQLTICKFLNHLHEKKIDFHFVFVGKRIDSAPELYDECIDFCQKNGFISRISFLGVRNDVPAILHQLDAFIYSTNHDTFGIAVVEAMAVGLPIFVNDWAVMKEITDEGKFATIYKTKNENDLLRQFMLFLQNKKPYEQKAIQAKLFVRQNFGIEKHIINLKEVYSGL
jgi:glycosyltransferase involved in cell wall biosynthesis